MKYFQDKYPIVKKSVLSKSCYDFTIRCPEIAEVAKCGQFVHIKADGFMLRRPISICEIDRENKTIRIVFEVRGEGTLKLSELNTSNTIDVIGPLGNGFTILDKDKKAIVIGGGIGTPPMLEVAKQYDNPCAVIGFRSKDAVILEDDFNKANALTYVCTDDGTYGKKGYVSEALKEHLSKNQADIIYACGPHMMLKSIIEIADKYNIPCEVSLEERMGCGIGACLVCACKTVKDGKEYFAHVCKDGPVFSSKEVIL